MSSGSPLNSSLVLARKRFMDLGWLLTCVFNGCEFGCQGYGVRGCREAWGQYQQVTGINRSATFPRKHELSCAWFGTNSLERTIPLGPSTHIRAAVGKALSLCCPLVPPASTDTRHLLAVGCWVAISLPPLSQPCFHSQAVILHVSH